MGGTSGGGGRGASGGGKNKITGSFKTGRLNVDITGTPSRYFVKARLKEEKKSWLQKVIKNSPPEVEATFSVSKKQAYMERMDAIPGKGYGGEILGKLLTRLKGKGIKSVKTYIENRNIASISMVRKKGFAKTTPGVGGSGYYYEKKF